MADKDDPMKIYNLYFIRHSFKACCFSRVKYPTSEQQLWFPKSVIEVDGVKQDVDFQELISGLEVEVYITDKWAIKKGLI